MSDEAEVDPVTALVENLQRKEVCFEKCLFTKLKMFSLKPISADEFQLMQHSAKSASGPGLLETSRVLARGYALAPRIIPAEGCSQLLSCGPNRLMPDSPEQPCSCSEKVRQTFPRI